MRAGNLAALIAFFTLSCSLMVVFTVDPLGLTKRLLPEETAHLVAAWTPNIAAVAVIGLTTGRMGLKRWVLGWSQWRVGWGWYLTAISPIAIAFLDSGIWVLLGGKLEPSRQITFAALVSQLSWLVIMGASGEEGGWRGFAQPLLQSRFSVLTSSIFVGLMWAVWHLPAYFVEGMVNNSMPFWLLTAIIVPNAVVMAWIWNRTRGSTLLASLYHFSLNASWLIASGVLHRRSAGRGSMYFSAGLYLVFGAAVALFGLRRAKLATEAGERSKSVKRCGTAERVI